jgi:hypothetical protein
MTAEQSFRSNADSRLDPDRVVERTSNALISHGQLAQSTERSP